MVVSTEYPITCIVFLSYILKIAPMIETQSILTNTTTVRLTHMRKRVKHTQWKDEIANQTEYQTKYGECAKAFIKRHLAGWSLHDIRKKKETKKKVDEEQEESLQMLLLIFRQIFIMKRMIRWGWRQHISKYNISWFQTCFHMTFHRLGDNWWPAMTRFSYKVCIKLELDKISMYHVMCDSIAISKYQEYW